MRKEQSNCSVSIALDTRIIELLAPRRPERVSRVPGGNAFVACFYIYDL